MTQNTSHAVMQQRSEAHDSLDDFPTPPWATRALMEHVIQPHTLHGSYHKGMGVWEPACNRGYMARPLSEYFRRTHFSDIQYYGWRGQNRVVDFLYPGSEDALCEDPADWIITNPPFRLASQFVERSLSLTNQCAMLVRIAFLEGVGRYNELFSVRPPTIVAQFTERVPMVKGRHDPDASTATAYCWIVWSSNIVPRIGKTEFVWIPPCRRQLQRQTDA
jgi:hypothetical protein